MRNSNNFFDQTNGKGCKFENLKFIPVRVFYETGLGRHWSWLELYERSEFAKKRWCSLSTCQKTVNEKLSCFILAIYSELGVYQGVFSYGKEQIICNYGLKKWNRAKYYYWNLKNTQFYFIFWTIFLHYYLNLMYHQVWKWIIANTFELIWMRCDGCVTSQVGVHVVLHGFILSLDGLKNHVHILTKVSRSDRGCHNEENILHFTWSFIPFKGDTLMAFKHII